MLVNVYLIVMEPEFEGSIVQKRGNGCLTMSNSCLTMSNSYSTMSDTEDMLENICGFVEYDDHMFDYVKHDREDVERTDN